MISPVLVALSLLAPPKFSFYSQGPYDTFVPTPEKTLGYELGSKHTVFRDQERVLFAIADSAKAKVVPMEFGRTAEGRPLRLFAISSPDNIRKLEDIRKANLRLANPKPGEDLSPLIKSNPAIVWVNETIHGDETASFESAMALVYNLAASRGARIREMLDNAVVLINPVYNPDGHERYVVAYNSIPNGSPEPGAYDSSIPSAFFGRANHYRFDMNRDRVAMSQDETRQEVAMYLKWMPQVYIDQHGQVETYFFPPVQQSVNVNVDRERYNKWTDIFGRATAGSFDANGWTYFIRDQFDFYNVCYLDSHSTLMGAIGMTQETDGGRVLASRRRDDTILTMRDGAAKHFTSALAVIEAAAKRKELLLDSYLAHKKKAVSGEFAGKFKRVVVEPMSGAERRRFSQHLDSTGIRYQIADEDWSQKDAHDYWSEKVGEQNFKRGSIIIDMPQPMGHLAKAWLEPGSDFEADFIARQKQLAKVQKDGKGDSEIDLFEFYDATAWCRIYAYDLKAWWCESTPVVKPSQLILARSDHGLGDASAGYYLPYKDQEDILFVVQALNEGIKCSMSTKPMKVGGVTIPRGTFFFLAARNEEGFGKKLLSMSFPRQVMGLKSSYPDEGRQGPGSESMIQLRKPKIGIVMGATGNLGSSGPLWYLMEREFKLPFVPLSVNALNGDLGDYTCIVVPGSGGSTTGKFGDWIRAGGCAVATSNSAWALGAGGAGLETTSADPDLPGSLFLAELDPKSFLSYGYQAPEKGPIKIAVPISGSNFYKAPKSGSAVQLSDADSVKKLLSGWSWDTTEKDLKGIAWLHDSPMGQGRIVIFTEDPTERAQWPGLFKMLLNAMIIGPSA